MGADPPSPPYVQPDRKIFAFLLLTTPLKSYLPGNVNMLQAEIDSLDRNIIFVKETFQHGLICVQ